MNQHPDGYAVCDVAAVEAYMANQNMPNDASRKSKAEGERWSPDSENAGVRERSGYRTDEEGSGITNRSLDEELENQQALPERGGSKPGGHAGHGDSESPRSSER
jgi:hypothetical protein